MSKTSLSSLLTVSILDTGCPGLYPWGIRLDDSFKTVTLECGPQTEGCSEKSPWNKKKFHNYTDMIWWINNFHHKFDSFPSLKIFLMRMMVIKPIVIILILYNEMHQYLKDRNNGQLVFSEKAMEPHSSTLAWKIPWTEEPGRLQSMGLQRVRHDWPTSLLIFTYMHWRRKWQPTPVFLPGESQGRRSLVGCCLWGRRVGHNWSNLAGVAVISEWLMYVTKCYKLMHNSD